MKQHIDNFIKNYKEKIKNIHKNYIIVVVSAIGVFVLFYMWFIQYKYFNYGDSIIEARKNIISLNLKIKKLNKEKTALEDNYTADSKELNDLKAALAKIQTDLDAAQKRLDSLK